MTEPPLARASAQSKPPEGRLPVVTDYPKRMQRLLEEIYAQSADLIGAQAQAGLIPAGAISVQMPAWNTVHARTATAGQHTTIKVSVGMVHLLYRMNRALALRVRIDTDTQPAAGDGVGELATLIDRAAAPMMPLRSGPPLPQQQVQVAELYTHWGEKFLLNHELAHAHHIDSAALTRVPVLAPFAADPTPYGREHAADLFGVWLSVRQADRQLDAAAARDVTTNADERARFERTVYAGAEQALRAISLLEAYDETVRTPTHPGAGERIAFLRSAHAQSGQGQLVAEALQWDGLFTANAAPAVARAQISAEVAVRNLQYYLDSGQLPTAPGGDVGDPIASLIQLSRSGSMRLLLRMLRDGGSSTAGQRARQVAEQYLPRADPAYQPFWDAVDYHEGGWT